MPYINFHDICLSNKELQSLPPGLVAVFAGATDGIGLGTLRAFAKYVNGPIAFIIGRSEKKGAMIIDELKTINPMGSFQFIEGQISLIKEVDRISEIIRKATNHVDFLIMSPGYLSFGGKEQTKERIETSVALQYYSRIRLTLNLLPLLSLSSSPRVISVLAAGNEGPLELANLSAFDETPFSPGSGGPFATMTTLIFEELAKENPTISFIHAFPGWVDTHILDHLLSSAPAPLSYLLKILQYTLLPLVVKTLFISPDEAGERTLFLATSARYPPAKDHSANGKIMGFVECRPEEIGVARSTVMEEGRGNGVYRSMWDGNVCKESKLLNQYRKEEVGKKVLEHTLGVLGRAAKC